MGERIRQCARVDHSLLDEDLAERTAHVLCRVSDLATGHIFFTMQVVEISTDRAGPIRPWKNSLAIAIDIDILRCPPRAPPIAPSLTGNL
jgi:hypothetical protein